MVMEDDRTPALFISKTGASTAGLRLLAALPNEVDSFEVSKLVRIRDTAGYNLHVTFRNPALNPVRITEGHLQSLLDRSKGKGK